MRTLITNTPIVGVRYWNGKETHAQLSPKGSPGWEFSVTHNNRTVVIPVALPFLYAPRNIYEGQTITLSALSLKLHTIEHLMCLRLGLGLDGIRVELNDPMVPFVAAPVTHIHCLPGSMMEEFPVRRVIGKHMEVGKENVYLSYAPDPKDKLVVEIQVDYPSPAGKQSLIWSDDDAERFELLAKGRPFVWRPYQVWLLAMAQILHIPTAVTGHEFSLTAGNYESNKCVFENGRSIDVAAHRLCDFLGLAGLLPGHIAGTFKIHRSSHAWDTRLIRAIYEGGLEAAPQSDPASAIQEAPTTMRIDKPAAPPPLSELVYSDLIDSFPQFSGRPQKANRILVIDDDMIAPGNSWLPIFKEALQHTDVEFALARTSLPSWNPGFNRTLQADALRLVGETSFDLILVDGLNTFGEYIIQALDALPSRRTFWVAAYSTDEGMNRCMIIKGADFAVRKKGKEFGPVDLIPTIPELRDALELKREYGTPSNG